MSYEQIGVTDKQKEYYFETVHSTITTYYVLCKRYDCCSGVHRPTYNSS